MRYPYHVTLIVSDAERELARGLAMSELGSVEGAGWFNIGLIDDSANIFWASASVLTQRNLDTINYYQSTENALTSLRIFALDNGSRTLVSSNVDEAQSSIGTSVSFGDMLSMLGLVAH